MRDNLWRRVIKRLALWRFNFDLDIAKQIRPYLGYKDIYTLKGDCNGCGACCREVTISTNRLVFSVGFLRYLFLAWHGHVNQFRLTSMNKDTHTLTFSCDHYDPVTKLCDSYGTRPGLCRNYPRNLLDEVNPEFFPDCSFYAELKTASKFREALKGLELSAEAREDLERKLHIKE